MSLDFTNILSTQKADELIEPREIFATLPSKAADYNYLRDVQSEVLDQWSARRNEKDLRLKMNTGGGKTMVGLLILKACLNEKVGPAVYVAPTPYLVSQAVAEAGRLGLKVETDPRASSVARGQAILITSINVLINGKSKFGVAPGKAEIEIGSLVLDDAHACLATAEEQFTLVIGKANDAYDQLLTLFEPVLQSQSSSRFLEVKSCEPGRFAQVPYWAWQENITKVEEVLYAQKDDSKLMFQWPLLSDSLRLCRCVIGEGQIEISPPCLPVDVIPSFSKAKRRIFMSATFADDGILITHFDAEVKTIKEAIAPRSASDLGERLILVPQELDPAITDEEIIEYAKAQAAHRSVVVIVPSYYRSTFWEDVADKIVSAKELEASVEELKKAGRGLVVFVNQYDGIDLPQDACRLLILDGLPDVRRMIDKLEESSLHGTSISVTRTVQMIEQGMGRGVRANDDYCAVLLMGRTLVGRLFNANGIGLFTPATKAQFELSEKIAEQIRNKGIAGISDAFDYLFSRNSDWISAAKAATVQLKYETGASNLDIPIARRIAFNLASLGDYDEAGKVLQAARNDCSEDQVKGWIGFQLAEERNFLDQVESQLILQSAVAQNKQIPIRPLKGITYIRLGERAKGQGEQCLLNLRDAYSDNNQLLVGLNSIIDNLQFCPDSFERFERAMAQLAILLGFDSQRPETESGAGPDVLWATGGLRYFVIECKNEAVATTVTKGYTNQLAGSVNWFTTTYDQTCTCTPIMIHPSAQFEHAATPPAETRMIGVKNLQDLCDAVKQFGVSIGPVFRTADAKLAAQYLQASNLLPEQIIQSFTADPVAAR
ncbi:MAG: DEAD/DEAH box helicase family protein [Armatimonadetes bacterium]|nr:DEAD/DEAH box helicase family protein [Armatimonadota bacterium]